MNRRSLVSGHKVVSSFSVTIGIIGLSILSGLGTGCSDTTIKEGHYPPARVVAHLTDSQIKAGQQTDVTCSVFDISGNQLDGMKTFIKDASNLTIEGIRVGGTLAGDYQVSCDLVDHPDTLKLVPASLKIIPSDPAVLRLSVEPQENCYAVNTLVKITAVVQDQYENAIQDPPLDWNHPTDGLHFKESTLSPEVTLLGEGMFTIEAQLRAPFQQVRGELILCCDQTLPEITIEYPQRGSTLRSDVTNPGKVVARGLVKETGSGLASVAINGLEVTVESSGSFEFPMTAKHGLNVLSVTARDRAGLAGQAVTSFYYSDQYLEIPEDPETNSDLISQGLANFIGQKVLDDGSRNCSFSEEGDGGYRCQPTEEGDAYDDIATLLEVILNNINFVEALGAQIYNSGWKQVAKEPLENMILDINELTGGLAPYEIQGEFVFRGRYRVYANMVSIDVGQAAMGDPEGGILGLEAQDGGLGFLAYLRPYGDKAKGISAAMEVHLDFDFNIVFSLDKKYHPENGIHEIDPATGSRTQEVTEQGCDENGILAIIDEIVTLLGSENPNFYGYICQENPLAQVTPNTFTGATGSLEKVRIAAQGAIQLAQTGEVDVTLSPPEEGFLFEFLDGALSIDKIDPITLDFSEVEVFGGLWVVDLGQTQISDFQPYLAEFLSSGIDSLKALLEPLLEDLIICNGSISGCPLNIESELEKILNSLQMNGESYWISPFLSSTPQPYEYQVTSRFSNIKLDPTGFRLGYDYRIRSSQIPETPTHALLGVLLVGNGCEQGSVFDSLDDNYPLGVNQSFDLINQTLFASWQSNAWNDVISASLSTASDDFQGITAEVDSYLPPLLNDCNATMKNPEFQVGSMHLVLSMELDGKPISVEGFVDLSIEVLPKGLSGSLAFEVLTPSLFSLELVGLEEQNMAEQKTKIESFLQERITQAVQDYLQRMLSAIPVPILTLTHAGIPGVPENIQIPFVVDKASSSKNILRQVSNQ